MTTPPIRLLLARHGATPWNDEHRIIGRTDLPLSERGRIQAKLLAGRLKAEIDGGMQVDALYSSPLRRAEATASTIAETCGLSYELDDRLRETDLGVWEGLTLAEAESRFAHDLAAWQNDPKAAPTDGESPISLQARVADLLTMIRARHGGQTVALVGHGGVFQALLFAVLGLPYRNDWVFYLYNGSLSELWLREPRSVAVYLNDTAHLGPQQTPT